MIQIAGDTLRVQFREWSMEVYEIFLRSKRLPESNLDYDWQTDTYELTAPSRFARVFDLQDTNLDWGWLLLAGHLFDYQRFIVPVALEAKRYAIWADTGLGKTAMYLEWARQVRHRTGGKVLLIVPLNIIPQTVQEAARFYAGSLLIHRVESREALRTWCTDGAVDIGIVNPEKFIPKGDEGEIVPEIRYCAGVVLDEASILKSGGGRIKWALIKSCKGVEYKLSCTATPAPNDTMEYASQGSFLERLRSEGEILWTFFTRTKEGDWKVKKHAEAAFYRFMSGWSVYLRNPKHYGFADNLKDLPAPIMREYRIRPTREQQAYVLDSVGEGQLHIFGTGRKLGMTERSRYSQLAKGFLYRGEKTLRVSSRKPGFVVDLIQEDAREGLQVLVWTVFDEESVILGEILERTGLSFKVLTGKTGKGDRARILEAFQEGSLQVLVSKASLLGYGLNLQNCGSMVFSGLNDSFEQFYQAVRRAYRYGQTRAVRVHIPYILELEGVVWANVRRKQAQFERDTRIMEESYLRALREVRVHNDSMPSLRLQG